MAENKKIIIEAKNQIEAKILAAAKLAVPIDNVILEYIEEKKSSILGMGQTTILVYNATAKKQVDIFDLATDILNELDTQTLDGSFSIKNGSPRVTNPQAGGKYSVIHGDNNLTIIVNGIEINGPTVVSEADIIQVFGKRKEPIFNYIVEVTKDKMSCLMKAVRSKGENYKPCDIEPTTEAYLKGELVETLSPPTITESEVLQSLKEQGIIFGINILAIRDVLNKASGKREIIAEGNKVLDGVDANIEYLFPVNYQSQDIFQMNTEDRINYFNRPQIKSVTIGEIIAIKRTAQQGVPGKNIYGEKILPKPPLDIEIRINHGVDLKENGTVVVANCNGRPVLDGRLKNILSVLPLHIVEGDVDVQKGNIFFKGDVLIKGSVMEGLKVQAGGMVEVLKNVNGVINATGNVIVHGNIIHAKIRAGGQTALFHQVYPVLNGILTILEKVYSTALQIKSHPTFRTNDLAQQGDGMLIKLLIESKFPTLSRYLVQLSEFINTNNDVEIESIKDLSCYLYNNLFGLAPLSIKSVEEINEFIQFINTTVNEIESSISEESSLTTKYIQNSIIQISGDLHLNGQGIYNSSVVAGGSAQIGGLKGIIRGSSVIAQKGIVANEIGSGFDTITSVSVSSQGKIKADLVYANVIIQVGTTQNRVLQNSRLVEACINKEGKLNINSLRN